jgi:pimeloyl-ACP methyl ester carboxylesterase
MKTSRSEFLVLRGLRHHVRTWGDPADPVLVLLHGWMDVSASFQFVVDALAAHWHVVAPDWRGFKLTEWARDGYWFPDYLADLDALLDAYAPGAPAAIVGHSMGGNIAGLYAGIRPARVSALVLAEGFGLKAGQSGQAPSRYGRWLDEVRTVSAFRSYADLAAVASHLRRNSPRLTEERACHLAPHWSVPQADGTLVPAADPRHKLVNPVLYRIEEAIACWRCITAPTLWVWGGDREWMKRFAGDDAADWAARRAAFAQLTECRIEDAGHMMHLERPEAFAAAVEPFLLAALPHPAPI